MFVSQVQSQPVHVCPWVLLYLFVPESLWICEIQSMAKYWAKNAWNALNGSIRFILFNSVYFNCHQSAYESACIAKPSKKCSSIRWCHQNSVLHWYSHTHSSPWTSDLGRTNEEQKASQWDRASRFPWREPGPITTMQLNGLRLNNEIDTCLFGLIDSGHRL